MTDLTRGTVEAKPITPDEARQALERERQARVFACEQELQEVLNRHRCQLALSGLAYHGDGRWVPQFRIASIE